MDDALSAGDRNSVFLPFTRDDELIDVACRVEDGREH
jgi:hypothetical protein